MAEREVISRRLARGASFQAIARELGCPASTVSREVSRNGGRVAYCAVQTYRAAWERAEHPKLFKLTRHPDLCRGVATKLETTWPPQQIAGWLKRQHPLDPIWSMSHETFYRTLFVQARGVLKRELLTHLRTQRRERHHRTKPADRRGQIPQAVSIRARPADVEDRAVPGHWEGALITGPRHASHLATLVERTTRFVVLVKVNSKDAQHLAKRLQRRIR